MARTVHTDEAATTAGEVALLLTYNESPDHPGLTRRYGGLMSIALMVAYIFRNPNGTKRCRHAFRVLTTAEKVAYQAERAALATGDGI